MVFSLTQKRIAKFGTVSCRRLMRSRINSALRVFVLMPTVPFPLECAYRNKQTGQALSSLRKKLKKKQKTLSAAGAISKELHAADSFIIHRKGATGFPAAP